MKIREVVLWMYFIQGKKALLDVPIFKERGLVLYQKM